MRFSLSSKDFSIFSRRDLYSDMETSLLIFGLFLIYLARLPNRRVETVSASLKIEGLQVMMRHVFELPPRDS
jgi:hypothetical protein